MKNTNKGFIGALVLGIIAAVIMIGSFVAFKNIHNQPVQSFGAFNPTGGGTYRLQSSVSSTQTTVTLTSFKEPISNIKYTMTYLNSSIEYATIDPQNSTSKEFISFTGITQNSDNTATLTGVSRGLGFSYPYTASTTLAQSHSGQSVFILSNPPQLTNQYANKANDETITGLYTFTQTPVGINPGGQPNASESVLGVVELATQIEMASSSSIGGTGGPIILQSKYATSSPYKSGLYIPVTQNDGTLNPNFIATSSAYTYNWGGNNSYTGTSLFTGVPTFNSGAVFNVAPTFGTFSATSSLVTSTSTIAGNLTVALNASTTNLTISNTCTGCGMSYTASSTAYSVTTGTVTYASNIPASANNGIGTFTVTINGAITQGTFSIARTGLTTATETYFVAGGSNAASYTLAWSGTSLVVSEASDVGSNSSISGTVYWYK